MPIHHLLNEDSLKETLQSLHNNTPALWGKMSAQQMVEHLAESLRYTNGKKHSAIVLSPDKVTKAKPFIFSDMEMPHDVPSPLQGDVPPDVVNADLKSAIQVLLEELRLFHEYYIAHPAQQENHHIFGALDYPEWQLFHVKHFTHHFKQFGLL
jgi:hydroxymethylglutaryl-CoA reductase